MEFEDVSPVLVGRLGDEASRGLLATLETTRQEWAAEVVAVAVERFDRRLTQEAGALRVATHEAHEAVRTDLKDVGVALRREIRDERRVFFRWSLLLWVVQALTTAALAATLLVISGW